MLCLRLFHATFRRLCVVGFVRFFLNGSSSWLMLETGPDRYSYTGFYADTHIRRPAMLHKVSDDCGRRVFSSFIFLSMESESVIAPDLQITTLAFAFSSCRCATSAR